MLGLRPWLAFFLRALCFFFWVRLDMGCTLPVGVSPTPAGVGRYAAAIRPGSGRTGGNQRGDRWRGDGRCAG